jgi:hypothetical protein
MPVQAVVALFFLPLLDPTRGDLPAALKRALEQLRRPLQSVIGATGGAAAEALQCRLYVLCLTKTRKFAIMNIE